MDILVRGWGTSGPQHHLIRPLEAISDVKSIYDHFHNNFNNHNNKHFEG